MPGAVTFDEREREREKERVREREKERGGEEIGTFGGSN